MEFSAGVMWAAGCVLLASLIVAFLLRRHRWSRPVAVVATIVCFHVTFILVPHVAESFGSGRWAYTPTGDVLGRIIASVITVSGVRNRWIWQAPKTNPYPGDGQTFYE